MRTRLSPELPAELHSEQLEEALQRVIARAGSQPDLPADMPPSSALQQPADAARLRTLLAVSPYLLQLSRRLPDSFVTLPATSTAPAAGSTASAAAPPDRQGPAPELTDEAQQMQWLRRHRHAQLVQILWRDLAQGVSLWETLTSLSRLADHCLQVAASWAHTAMQARYGEPRDADGQAQRLVVLGMGKLGGGELNVSSDVDLIYLFRENGSTDGRRRIDNGEFFRRVAQRLSRLLAAVTEDGFAYRVDTRLRPFGESGPLAMSFAALEHYLLTQARSWERYAMVKARVVSGEVADGDALHDLLRPFVYRRYLDYSAIDALRELKRKIVQSVREKGLDANIKLGAGGIREVEFIVQSFQLVRGGREPRLRERSIERALPLLAELGLLDTDEVASLHDAYVFLRRVENAVQTLHDQQVHSLPTDPVDRLRLVVMLGYEDWHSLQLAIDAVRACVSAQFARLFSDQYSDESTAQGAASNPTQAASDAVNVAATEAWEHFAAAPADAGLQALGIAPVDGLLDALSDLCRGAFYKRLHASAQRRVERIMPLLLVAVPPATGKADTATTATSAGSTQSATELARGTLLLRCARFVRAVAGRSGYLQVLSDHPVALDRLVELFAHSAWIAGFVTRHPIVLDELVGPTANRPLPDRQALAAEVAAEARRVANADLEQQMDALRQYRNAHVLHVACAEIDGSLGIMQVSDQLSWLAEALVDAVLTLVTPALQQRFGSPSCLVDGELRQPQLGIVAYGKLGGLELGHGSDLDLVFVHDSAGSAQQTDGGKPIENTVYYARLAKAFASFMSTRTSAGTLYEIDTRLRPNGRSGVLVIGIDSFARYQSTEAWTWEHQALVRARVVAGSATLRTAFDTVRKEVLCRPRDAGTLREQVVSMRRRMVDELSSRAPGHMDLKQDRGGVVDIEFLVQFLVLAHARQHPALLAFTDNIRLLEVLEKTGLLDLAAAHVLRQCYRELRARLHRQALREQTGPVVLDAALATLQQQVSEVCASVG